MDIPVVLRSTADWPNGKGPNTRGLRLGGHASNFARGLDLFGHQVVDARSRGLDLIEHEALFVASLIVQAILVAGDVTFCKLVVWNMTFSPRTIGCFRSAGGWTFEDQHSSPKFRVASDAVSCR